jgi:transposase-like protein
MSHRIREAMRDGVLAPMGGNGAPVEIDETYFGRMETPRPSPARKGRPPLKRKRDWDKRAVVSLVERGGKVRSFHVENADKASVTIIVNDNLAREAAVYTDESKLYNDVTDHAASHATVKHSAGEYVRKEWVWNTDNTEMHMTKIHTNSVEGFFSIFKRGMKGVYQHCGEKHLHRYLAEFDFRYNNRIRLGIDDQARTDAAIRGVVGKRLTYRTTSGG